MNGWDMDCFIVAGTDEWMNERILRIYEWVDEWTDE